MDKKDVRVLAVTLSLIAVYFSVMMILPPSAFQLAAIIGISLPFIIFPTALLIIVNKEHRALRSSERKKN